MILMGLLAGIAGQSAVTRPSPPPPIIVIPRSYSALLPEIAVPAVRATPGQSLPTLFSSNDYPVAALRDGEMGTTAVVLAIAPDGRVSQCSIATSSGSASLDSATCSILVRRARFTPARDGDGNAAEDRFASRIRWILPPRPPTPFADHRTALVFTTDAAGAVMACRVEGSTDSSGNDRLCAAMMPQARAIVSQAARTSVMADRELVLEQGFLIGGPESARHIGQRPGETLGMQFALVLEIDPAGAISYCGSDRDGDDRQRVTAACADTVKRKFVPADSATGDQSVRRGVRYWASYTRPIG